MGAARGLAVGVLKRRARNGAATRLPLSPPLALVLALAGIVLTSACRDEGPSGIGRHAAQGTVEDVDRENAQVLIEHGDIPGLMPAMTMNFAVPDADVLARLARGQVIEFELDFTGRSYEVVDFEVVGEGKPEAGWRRLGEALVRSRAAPDFALVDQAGRAKSSADVAGRVLLVDFIYTACPGPCPIQTARQVALQRRIPPALRGERVFFLSFSLDPARDDPPTLARYAAERGADLASWAFLTGSAEALADLARAYGVGSLRKEDGTIDHTLVTFLVHDGRILESYYPRPGEEDRLLADVLALAGTGAEAGAAPAAGTARVEVD